MRNKLIGQKAPLRDSIELRDAAQSVIGLIAPGSIAQKQPVAVDPAGQRANGAEGVIVVPLHEITF